MKRFLYIIIFILIELPLCGQDVRIGDLEETLLKAQHDSEIVVALTELSKRYMSNDMTRAKSYCDSAVFLAKEINFTDGIIKGTNLLAILAFNRGEYETAIERFQASAELNHIAGKKHAAARSIANIGNVYNSMGNYPMALKYFFETILLFDSLGETGDVAINQNSIGAVYYMQKEYNKAIEYYELAFELNASLDKKNESATNLCNIAMVYEDRKEFDKTIEFCNKALKLFSEVKNNRGIAETYIVIGGSYNSKKDFKKAQEYFQMALTIWVELDDPFGQANTFGFLGNSTVSLGSPEKGISYFKQSLNLAEGIGASNLVLDAYLDLAKGYKALGDYKTAYFYQEQMYILKDSLFNETKSAQIAEMGEKYETIKKNNKIAELERKEAEALFLAEKRKYIMLAAGIVLFALILIVVLYLKQQKAKEKQQKAELEQKALRAQMNPHFIFNSLASLQRMYVDGQTERANDFMADFGQLMRKILDHTGRPLINVKDELDTLRLYINLEKGRLDGKLEYEIIIDETIDEQGTLMPPMVIQPIVENAIWHGIVPNEGKGKIKIECNMIRPELIECTITDDGVGIETSQKEKRKEGIKHESIGIKLTEQRLGVRDAITATELTEGGTQVTLIIPVQYEN